MGERRTGGLWTPQTRALTVGLVLTITFVASEALAVVTVMPVVARDLGGLRLYGWAFSAFMLGSVVGIVAAGREADRRGPAVPFVAALILFGSGLAIAGLAPSMEVLVGGRVLQGMGAGAVPSVAYAVIGRSFPGPLQARMMAVLSTAWVVPGVAGPALAAAVAHLFGWRWVFLGLLPVVAVAGSIAMPALIRLGPPASRQVEEHRLIHGIAVAACATMLLAGLTLVAGSGAVLAGGALIVAGVAGGLPALRRLVPPGTPDRPPGSARHDSHPGAADLRLFRCGHLRDASDHGGAPSQPGGGWHRRHRRHAGLDSRRLGAGTAERDLARTPFRAHRAGDHPGRHRRDDPGAPADSPGGRGPGGVDCCGPGHGAGVRAALADDAAEGTARRRRTSIGVTEPGRRARHRHRHRRGRRGRGGREPCAGHRGRVRCGWRGRCGGADDHPPAAAGYHRVATSRRPARARAGARSGGPALERGSGSRQAASW